MTLATLGWVGWWVALVVAKLAPGAVGAVVIGASAAGVLFALPGVLLAAASMRARRTWILFVLAPLFANGTLLCMPWLAEGLFERV